MDLSKKEIKALVLDIRKPMAGVNEILKDANGKVRNEGQEVSYVTLLDLQRFLGGIVKQGFTMIRVVSYGTFKKEDVDGIMGEILPKQPVSKEDEIEILRKQTEELKAQIDAINSAKVDENKKENKYTNFIINLTIKC